MVFSLTLSLGDLCHMLMIAEVRPDHDFLELV
jgi:hypothetical protein